MATDAAKDAAKPSGTGGGGEGGGEGAAKPAAAAKRVFMGEGEKAAALPERFQKPELFARAYDKAAPKRRGTNPLYKTTMEQLGSRAPSEHEMPKSYRPRPQNFSNSFTTMYRNYGLNTAPSKPKPPTEYDLTLF